MVFDHRVKYKGVLYEAGQNVPIKENHAEDVAEKKVASSSHLFPAEEKPKRRGRPKKE